MTKRTETRLIWATIATGLLMVVGASAQVAVGRYGRYSVLTAKPTAPPAGYVNTYIKSSDAGVLLYQENSSAVETAIGSGSGAVSAPLTLTDNTTGTAQNIGVSLENTTPATVGVQKYSPIERLRGAGWGTTAPASQTVDFALQCVPLQSTTARAALTFSESIAGAGYTELARLYHDTAQAQVIMKFADLGFGEAIISGPGSSFDLILANNATLASSYIDIGNATVTVSSSNLKPASDDTTTFGTTANRLLSVDSYWYDHKLGAALTVSANTITPTAGFHHVGAGLIKTIATTNVPASALVVLYLIPDAAFTYDATANIVVPAGGGTAVINKLMIVMWDGTKWTPSY